MSEPVGRDEERRRIVGLLDEDGPDGPAAVVVTAEAGLGKTVLVDDLRREAVRRHRRVLHVQPLEAEAILAFSALGELLAGIREEEYDELPPPQRRALRAALLLDDADRPIDPRAVAAGVGTLLDGLARREPVLIVVDDAHWLDDASGHALGRGLRRVTAAGLRLLVAARPEGLPLDTWLPEWVRDRLHLAGLAPDDLAQVVRDRAGVLLDPAAERALADAAGGNPLFALELARHRTGGAVETFGRLVGARIAALPRPSRLALLSAALAGTATTELVATACGTKPAALLDRLEPAVAADLVRITDRIAFVHPLYAASVIGGSASADVTAAHERLAEVAPSEEARARHLGAARSAPDAQLAARLEAAARHARDRGGIASAAELLELAVRRTPADDLQRDRRTVLLGRWLVRAGRIADGAAWLRDVRDRGPGPEWWEASTYLGWALVYTNELTEARAIADELGAAELAPAQRAEADLVLRNEFLPAGAAREVIADANRVLRDHEAPAGLRAAGLTLETRLARNLGLPDPGLLAEAIALEELEPPAALSDGADLEQARAAAIDGRVDEARSRYAALLRRCAEDGDDVSVPVVLVHAAQVESRSGAWERARELLDRAVASAGGQGQFYRAFAEVVLAWIDGMRGDLAGAERGVRRAWDVLADYDDVFGAVTWSMLAAVRAAHGDADGAHAAYLTAEEHRRAAEWDDPADLRLETDLADAAIAVGRHEEAAAVVDAVEAWATGRGHGPTLADCRRARLLLTVARGDVDAAVAAVPALLAGVDDDYDPLRRGRTWLAAGMTLRRGRQRRAAYDALTIAVEIFEGLGCAPYAQRARAELARVGLRHGDPDRLSETELRVATMAAKGMRNAEIAAAAFLSVKTVEAVLGRAYRKLGISRRAELTRALDGVSGDTR